MLDQILADLKTAMLSRDSTATNVLQAVKSGLKYAEIEKGEDLTEPEQVKVIKKEAKKRQEAIDIYSKAGREEQAAQEKAELAVLEKYLPQQMSDDELIAEVEQAVEKLAASQPSDTGKVMGYLAQKLLGRADNRRVSELVRERLSGSGS